MAKEFTPETTNNRLVKHLLKTSCTATVEESWIVEAPDDAGEEELMAILAGGGGEFVSDRVTDGEGDREFVEASRHLVSSEGDGPRCLVVVEGGVITGIYADAAVRVCVKDWDTIEEHGRAFQAHFARADRIVTATELDGMAVEGTQQ